MRMVNIEDAEEGMVVARNVLKASGQCLVSRGTILTMSMIKSLPRYGVMKILIQSAEDNLESFSEDEISQTEEVCKGKVLARFRELPSDPMLKILFDSALRIEALEHLRCKQK